MMRLFVQLQKEQDAGKGLAQQLDAERALAARRAQEVEAAGTHLAEEQRKWEALGAQQVAALEKCKGERDEAVAASRDLSTQVRDFFSHT